VLLAAVAGAAVLAAAGQSAPTLGWDESAQVSGNDVLSFKVDSLVIGKTGWSARVSFRNESKQTLRVGNVFGLTLYRGAGITPTTRADAFGPATAFSPRRPTTLRPGASWSGVIRGTGHPQPKLTGKVYARVLFGPFYNVPGWPRPFFWITDHARPVRLAGGSSNKLVI